MLARFAQWGRLLEPPLGAIIFGGIASAGVFAVIGYFWLRSLELRLKQSMVNRGFSAVEIERVISTSADSKASNPSDAVRDTTGPAQLHSV